MSPERWRRIQDLLDRALEVSAAERDAFLSDACPGDPALAAEVRSLLDPGDLGSFLEHPPRPALPTNAPSPSHAGERTAVSASDLGALVGQDVGPYHIVREVSRGGMGVVYEALQKTPVERRVALKLIKWGMDTQQVIARFESERQALALMSHPGIAAVYDAGATERGRPWFAMEYVSGVPITEYCDTHHLGLRERLELFIRVCEAIQHAHQKGIIHRDIKPANILVTVQGATPVPKVIDFGVAKATAQRLTEKTLFTEQGQLIGTPSHMSPEQAEMTGLDIDTRSDVYSLGALLYELLAGCAPFDSKELRHAGIEELRRKIREDEPPLPSARVLASEQGDGITERRRTADAVALAREIRGDLDWISARALAKNRTSRYGTASELGDDVARHLRHEPVRASPPSVRYRLAKFVRRHRTGVVSGGVAALALVLAVAGTVVGLVRSREAERQARSEAAKARAVNEFLERMLGSANPMAEGGRELTVVEALSAASDQVERSFADQPETKAAVLNTIGITYSELGRYDDAERLLRASLESRRGLPEPSHPEVADSLEALGRVLTSTGDYDEGEKLLREAVSIRRGLQRPASELGKSLNDLGALLIERSELKSASEVLREALALIRGDGSAHRLDLAGAANNLGLVLWARGELASAERLHREALEIRRAELGDSHPLVAETLNNLATSLYKREAFAEAEELFRRALELRVAALGEDHIAVANGRANLANTLRVQGSCDEAEGLYQQTLRVLEATLGPADWRVALTKSSYGQCLIEMRRFPEAHAVLAEAVETFVSTRGPTHYQTLNAARRLIQLFEAWEKPERAEPYRAILERAPQDGSSGAATGDR